MRKRTSRKTTRKRKTRAVKKRSAAKNAKKRKRPSAKRKKVAAGSSLTANRKAHWEAYKHLQTRCEKALAKIKADVRRKAKPAVILRDRNQLLLLLGECNYMARECMRFEHNKKQR